MPFFEVYRDEAARGSPRTSLPLADPIDRPGAPPAAVAAGPTPRPIAPAPSTEVVVRPLGSWAWSGPDRRWLKVLWPLVDFTWDGAEREGWVLPFWYRKVRSEPEGGRFGRWWLFPILFAGRSDAEGSHFAVLPIGGKIRRILGQDEIDFVLFPAWWHSRWHDWHSLHVLFPFYNRVWGGGRTGWRIWPFYGHYHAFTEDGRERYERRFILWPFFFRQRNDLNTRRPQELIFFLPFYGRAESPHTITTTWLWPIFHTTLDRTTGRKTYFGYLIPYRFNQDQFDLWPFFGFKHTRNVTETSLATGMVDRRRHFILFPIERWDREEDDVRIVERFWLLPLFWRFREVRKADGEESLEWKVWPLMRWTSAGARKDFHFPSLLPFRQVVPMERLYARLWRLFLFHEDEGQRGWEALFNVLSYRNRKTDDVRTFRVLGGLFELRRSPEGASFRLFYLPWRGEG